ncbi:hypothetical protein [Acinetobacter sp. NIPH 2699]|uniref:hypothetical protein n=1 Tax=Acinetobacter sp. NIPH 2699 TaxID=2923433 RepID=UPI001F4AC305|nr:hypothetical protein [Acinetobacter sp. NIPH 2699]MCH7335482.1 hypothetical protein [Acinetobacter sp. NIPH 2699]
MGNLFKIINAYYNAFESYSSVVYWKNAKIWTFVLLAIIFLYSFYWYTRLEAFPYFPDLGQTIRLIICIVFEVILLFNLFLIMQQRDKIIIKDMQEILDTKEQSLSKLKKIWLLKFLDVSPVNYVEIAEKIDKLINLKERNQSVFVFGSKQAMNILFQPESKNRTLAMFMGGCAVVMSLCIAAGSDINDVFDFYKGASIEKIALLDFLLAFYIVIATLILKYLCLMIFEMVGLFFDKIDKNRVVSRRRARIFINELLMFYDLPKGRFRVKSSKDQKNDERSELYNKN